MRPRSGHTLPTGDSAGATVGPRGEAIMRQGRGPGYKSVLQWSAVLLGAIALWTCVSMVRTQMKYLNHQGEGRVRRKKEIYSVEELGCDDCSPPPPSTGQREITQVGAARGGDVDDEPSSKIGRDGGHEAAVPLVHSAKAKHTKGVATQALMPRAEMMAKAAELRAARGSVQVLPHEIRNAAGLSQSDMGVARRSIPGSGKHLLRPAILLLGYKRPAMLQATLESLSELEGLQDFVVYLSQDGDSNQKVTQLLEAAVRPGSGILAPPRTQYAEVWHHVRDFQHGRHYDHSYLTLHYGWALGAVFQAPYRHDAVVVVEDDMSFSSDFLLFFQATAVLLKEDSSVWCISSWNDNGHKKLPRAMWEELGPKWPQDNWDWWLRREDVSRGRDCIVPEVSRNYNRGDVGSNMGKELYSKTLANYAWQNGPPIRDFGDLSYLLLKSYEERVQRLAEQAQPLDWKGQPSLIGLRPGGLYLLLYREEEYEALARRIPVWPVDPRGYHSNIAEVHYEHATFLIANIRSCELLPPPLREWPSVGMKPVLGRLMERSCARVCEELPGAHCSQRDFPWIHTCAALQSTAGTAGCPGGCALKQVTEVPTAPSVWQKECTLRAGFNGMPTCEAPSRWDPKLEDIPFKRLCPCVA